MGWGRAFNRGARKWRKVTVVSARTSARSAGLSTNLSRNKPEASLAARGARGQDILGARVRELRRGGPGRTRVSCARPWPSRRRPPRAGAGRRRADRAPRRGRRAGGDDGGRLRRRSARGRVSDSRTLGRAGRRLGPVGARVAGLGEAAVPVLGRARRRPPLRFSGSREATIGNGAGWRVKDAAAALLATICGRSFASDAEPAARDTRRSRG